MRHANVLIFISIQLEIRFWAANVNDRRAIIVWFSEWNIALAPNEYANVLNRNCFENTNNSIPFKLQNICKIFFNINSHLIKIY